MQSVKKGHGLKAGFKIIIGFLTIIIIGALLLHLPSATVEEGSLPIIDCFFTSFSAVCVTGLSVFAPGISLTTFGQVILILLIQIGGLGFMTVSSMLLLIARKKFSLRDRMAISASFGEDSTSGIVRLMKNAVYLTFSVEAIGCLLLMIRFIPMFGAKGIWYSVFHAISAFCNAGFDILPSTTNLAMFYNDPLIVLTVSALIIIGGIGFLVIIELGEKLFKREAKRKLVSMHTKVVLTVTVLLLVIGTLFFTLSEWNNPETIGNMTVGEKLLNGFFQSVTTRTAGFSTFNEGGMTSASKLLTTVFMLIGASPAGTGGGFKTTTLAVVFALFSSVIHGRNQVIIRKHSISKDAVNKALALILMVCGSVLLLTVATSLIDGARISMFDLVFEVCSAFGTVGLSCGITAQLSAASKWLLMLAMFFGRVGMLSVLTGITEQFTKHKNDIEYPDGKILIG